MIHDNVWKARERLYLDTLNKYQDEAEREFATMFCWLSDALEENITDVMGEIYMESGMGSKITGQFFTPFHVSLMSAQLALESYDGGKMILNEPSCGGGGMIIAAAKVLHDAGVNYQKALEVVAQDLDWKSVYMCYVQCSLLGIKAAVIQGDTLAQPLDLKKADRMHVLLTPQWMGALL